MNGEIPSVPITTLAGIASLTDLLPEMPLPSPLPQTLSNKSLLFHPRVAEEANILLSLSDDALVPQLVQSLAHTSADHIELKDHYTGAEPPVEEQNTPELLKAILQRNPNVFKGPLVNAMRGSTQLDLHHAATPLPPTIVAPPTICDNTRKAAPAALPNHVAVQHAKSTVPPPVPVLASPSGKTNGVVNPLRENITPPTPPSSVPRASKTHLPNLPDASPAQASVAPLPDSKTDSVLVKHETSLPEVRVKEPRIVLNRLTPQEQVGLKNSKHQTDETKKDNVIMTRNHYKKLKIESDSESDEEPRNKTKYFKARDKEREIQRRKEKDLRKKIENDEDVVDSAKHWSVNSKRKRSQKEAEPVENDNSDDSNIVPRTKLRKVERKLVPVIEKLGVDISVEELMETNTYQKFNRSIEKIFNNTDDVDLSVDPGDDDAVPAETMIPKYQLQDLCAEAAKLKTLGAMESIPSTRIIRLLGILEKNIRDGTKVSPLADPEDDEDERKLWMELAMERIQRAVDASLTTLYILTSPNMHKRVYLEDVIDRVVIFTKYQLLNTIFPSFDPVYRDVKDKDGYVGNLRKKRAHTKEVREKSVLSLYNKLVEVLSLMAELLSIQTLTDTAVLHISSMGISPFFVEGVSELQLSALKLVTNIFTKYEKHRKLLLDDILASMARLPSSKRSLRSYRLNSEEHIQMLTALVLQLIQCMVVIPISLSSDKQSDADSLISGKFTMARTTASNFLYIFLGKCSSKSEEIDYRPIFENFVQDLLTTVNKPEWPAAELMLSVLGHLLVASFTNKSLEMSLRVVSLDYLGVVAARLRKDVVQSTLKISTIDQIINEIKSEELKDDDGSLKEEVAPVADDEERTQFLQRVLLDYLAERGQADPALTYARHFYLAQWYQDNIRQVTTSPKTKTPQSKRAGSRHRTKPETYEEELSENEDDDEEKKKPAEKVDDPLETYRVTEARKKFLLSKIRPFEDTVLKDGRKNQTLTTYIDYDSAELVSRYLASKRPFSQSFSVYLKHILTVLMESSVLIRTKAMKCLTMIVEVDPAVLGLKAMRNGVHYSFLDHSTSVREAAVDLVGKFVLSRPELIDKYYDMLLARILDTGVSVRKRVIKILKDICIEYPEFPKIPEICVKIIRRVNDEDGIRKLVMEVFQNMWFTPVKEKPHLDKDVMIRKVMNITDVVSASEDINLEWFEQLLVSLFKPKEDKEDSTKVSHEHSKALLTACKQIVDCLIDHVLSLDGLGEGSSQRLIACLRTLFLFTKIKPQLLVEHAITLQPYLSVKCKTQGDYQIISCVARMLEIIVPLIEHPSETFLSRLEEDSVKLIMRQDPSVILSCVSCLGSVVNNVTRNFKLIRDCLKKYHGVLLYYKRISLEGKEEEVEKARPVIKRSLFIVGLLLRFFDFTDKEVLEGFPVEMRDQVFDTLLFYLEQRELKSFTLKAIGSVCIRHYELMLGPELKSLYHDILRSPDDYRELKIQILSNIEQYLQEEERRMIKQDQEWARLSQQENLKEMGDVSSGMASTVIQLYLKEILEAFLHPSVGVRQAALRVIQLILSQGLVHPVQIVPYLVCMSTDVDRTVSGSADKQLQDIEKKYPGFIHMKAQTGIKLSYKLQQILQAKQDTVRGFRVKEGEMPGALNGFLYSILRTKQQRRALALSILKQFDEQVKTSLSQMLYLADNMAYFPYQVHDEPLFIIHHIDIMISVNGTNLLQSFREALLPNPNAPAPQIDPATGQPIPTIDEDEEEDEDNILSRVPEDSSTLQECITASQGCLLLLVLKQHLKTLYGFNDSKITQYSPSETAKVYEKAVNRKSNSKFNPKATLQKIKQGVPTSFLDECAKRALVSEYFEFKHLIMNLDPDESDNEEVKNSSHPKSHMNTRGSGVVEPHPVAGFVPPVEERVGEQMTTPQASEPPPPPRVPKLTIVPPKPPDGKHHHHHHHHHRSHKTRKTDRHKKHHHKRKKSKLRSSDDESGNDYSDPDFLV